MKISTSILSSDDRVKCVQELNRTATSYIHVDVMDGIFVSDTQFETYEKIHSINLVSNKPLDVHLMVSDPIEYVKQLSNFNIEYVTFHVEVGQNIDKIIKSIHDMGYKVGLAIKPKTDVKILEKYLDSIDLILVMSVEPGKGGQEFINSSVDKLNKVKELVGNRNILIEVDGGINDTTIDMIKDVDIAVVGSYIVKSDNYYKSVETLISFKEGNVEKTKKVKSDKKSVKKFNKNRNIFLYIYIFLVSVDVVASFVFAIDRSITGINTGFCMGSAGEVCNTVFGIRAFLIAFPLGLIYFPMWFVATFFYRY